MDYVFVVGFDHQLKTSEGGKMDNRLNGIPGPCFEASLKDLSASEHQQGDELVNQIHAAAEAILRQHNSELAVRIIALEQATVNGAKLDITEWRPTPTADTYVYEKSNPEKTVTWSGIKKIYNYK